MKTTFYKQTGAAKIGVYLVTLAVLAALLGGLYWWRQLNVGQPQGWPQQAVPVTALQLSPQVLAETQTAMGTLSAVQEVVLAPEVAGRVTAINFVSGDQVGAGDVLVQLFDLTEKANLSAAKAAAKLAEAQLKRTQKLAPIGAESKELLTQREAESDRAQATVEQAQAQLQLKTISAPFSGQLGIRRVNVGEYLNPGDTVVSLTNLDKLYVDFAIPQQQLAKLAHGAPVTLNVDAFPDQLFSGTITTIEPQIEAATRNVIVQATLDNPDGLLRPSMYVNVSVKVAETPDALMGRTPDNIPGPAEECAAPPQPGQLLPVGSANELLRRRPDLRQAEAQLQGDAARLNVAIADLYPQISLGAGLNYFNSEAISSSDAFSFSLGPLISWRFPNQQQSRARIRQAEAQQQAGFAELENSVLNALSEVEQAMENVLAQQQRAAALEASMNAYQRAFDITQTRYQAGASSYIEVHTAQQDLLSVRTNHTAALQQLAAQRVTLFKALGGGWQQSPQPMTHTKNAHSEQGETHDI